MKKFLAICLSLLIAAGTMQMSAEKEYSKSCQKEAKAQAKTAAKKLQKDKWVFEGSTTLEYALEKYNLKTIEDCGDYTGYIQATTAKTISIARKTAANNLLGELAKQLRAEALGTVDTQTTEDEEFTDEKMSAIYGGEIANCYKEQLNISRKGKDGKYEVRVYFVVDKARFDKLAKTAASDIQEQNSRAENIREAVKKAHSQD